jgi:MoaA/NifB/PqqE/SkfB family radical SAM enzyme
LYNEPGIDPRLVFFMRKVKTMLPKAKLFLLTNGWYLDQTLAHEFEAHGLYYLVISAYGDKEFERLSRLKVDIPIRITREPLDNRMTWYEIQSDKSPARPCYCPVYELCITSKGEVCLCPFDWQRLHVFGNLHEDTLEVILGRSEIWQVYEELSSGRREFSICQGCPTYRGEPYPSTIGSESLDGSVHKKHD